jgi:DNA-binding NarL/FixJ family response regulator
MDVSMPELSGIAATRAIHGALPSARVVGLSSESEAAAGGVMRGAGAAAYFTKGDEPTPLLEWLLLNGQRQARVPISPILLRVRANRSQPTTCRSAPEPTSNGVTLPCPTDGHFLDWRLRAARPSSSGAGSTPCRNS